MSDANLKAVTREHAGLDNEAASASGGHALDTGLLPGEQAPPNLSHWLMLKDHMKPFSDVVIHTGKAKMFAHSYMLWVRAESMLSPKDRAAFDKRKKSRTATVVLDLQAPPRMPPEMWNSGTVMFMLLMFLYRGAVQFSKRSAHEVLGLNLLAKHYKLDRLSYICELYLRETLTLENAAQLLRWAHDMQDGTVKRFCMAFAMRNYTAFIASKEGVTVLGLDLFQEVVAANASGQPLADEQRQPPPNHYLEQLKHLHDEMPFADAVAHFPAERVRFHRAVLAAHSHKLADFLHKNASQDEMQFAHTTAEGVTKPMISADAFKSMLRFVYYGERQIDPLHATELIAFAKEFDLPDLQKACEARITTNVTVETVLEILNVTYLPHMETRPDVLELRAGCIAFLLEHLDRIELTPLRKMPPHISIDVLLVSQTRERQAGAAGSGQDLAAAIAVLRETSPRPTPSAPPPVSPGRGEKTKSNKNLRAAEEAAAKKKEEEEERRRHEEKAKAKATEEERKRKAAEEEAAAKEAAKKKEDEDRRKKEKEKEDAKTAEEERKRKEKEDRRKKEEDDKAAAKAEEERKRKEKEDRRKKEEDDKAAKKKDDKTGKDEKKDKKEKKDKDAKDGKDKSGSSPPTPQKQ